MDESDVSPWADEARARWGHTGAYEESARRAKGYRKEDWNRIRAEGERIEAGMAALLQAGEPADGAKAMDLAEQARLHIARWFYPCGHAMHAALADLYTSDPRFAAHYDGRAPGLAAFVARAIRANLTRSAT